MIISSFKNSKEILKANPLRFFPTVWTLENYVDLFEDTTYPFLQALGNTALVSIAAALLSVTINSMAGYAFARLNFTGKTLLWRYAIFAMYIPGITILVTSFVVVTRLGMLDSYWVLILPGLAGAYSIFFFRLNCQVKCNSVLKKTSKGDFQPRHLRGRRLSLAMKDAICPSPKFSISTDLGQYSRIRPFVFSFVPRSHGAWGFGK